MGRSEREGATSLGSLRFMAVLLLISLVVLASVPRLLGQVGMNSGSTLYTFGSTLSNNESNYTLYYSVPQVIQAGVKANMTFYIYLTLLSGWKIQSQTQILQIVINTPTKQVTTQETENKVTLYQGGRWGPFNMTFDLNDSQAGLSPGQAASATVFANLVVYEAYDDPNAPFVHDAAMTLPLTEVQLAATPGGTGSSIGRIVASLAVGVAVVGVLVGVTLTTRKKNDGLPGSGGLASAVCHPLPQRPEVC